MPRCRAEIRPADSRAFKPRYLAWRVMPNCFRPALARRNGLEPFRRWRYQSTAPRAAALPGRAQAFWNQPRGMDGMKALAQRENVVCKISGIIATAKEDWKAADLAPNIRFSIQTFGPDRQMFAGDWPVCTLRASYRQWVGALKEIVREMKMPLADQKKLFHDNAVRFYGLKDKGYGAS